MIRKVAGTSEIFKIDKLPNGVLCLEVIKDLENINSVEKVFPAFESFTCFANPFMREAQKKDFSKENFSWKALE